MSSQQAPLSPIVPAKALLLLGLFLILVAFALPLFQVPPSAPGGEESWNLATLWNGPGLYLITLLEVVPLIGAGVAALRLMLGFARSNYDFRWLLIWAAWAALGLFALLTPAAFGVSPSDFPHVVSRLESGVLAMLAGYACLCAGAGVIAISARR